MVSGIKVDPQSGRPRKPLHSLRSTFTRRMLEQGKHADQLGPLRDALSRLQMAYAQGAREQPQPQEPPEAPKEQEKPEGPGPAQRSGKLWIPGQ